MELRCSTCKNMKDEECFAVNKKQARGRAYQCNECHGKIPRRKPTPEQVELKRRIDLAYAQSHVEQYRAWRAEWRKRNPNKIRAIYHNRRSAEGSFTPEELRELFDRYGHMCLRCGSTEDICADHIVPLARGGTNYIWNIQPLCRSCNSGKGTKTIDYRPII